MRSQIGLAARNKRFASVFSRYFRAAGYTVTQVKLASDFAGMVISHEINLLALDVAVFSEEPEAWRQALSLAR